MSNHNSSLDPFKEPNGSWTHTGSSNAGAHQANNNQPLSGQQPGESAGSYQSRESAYHHTNDNKSNG